MTGAPLPALVHPPILIPMSTPSTTPAAPASETPAAAPAPVAPLKGEADVVVPLKGVEQMPGEIGGPQGPEPTRYSDWAFKGRCSDF